MRKLTRIFFAVVSTAFLSAEAHAQFFVTGDEPSRVRWSETSTSNFRIIYPRGADSLAREYGRELEMWRVPVGQSIHYLPGQYTRGKMPVVLHPFNSFANGSVAWAPKRMDLYSIPDAYPFAPMSWGRMLAIHESRHVAQMQLGLSGALRPFGWIVGEMFNGAINALYGHGSWMEGDAVVTETALTPTGRGRTADFLGYYRISFDQGEMRDLNHWFRDSFVRHVPDKYALGYMMLSGFRYYYDDRDFMGNSWDHYSRRIFDVMNHYETKRVSGQILGKAFEDVTSRMARTWKEEMDARAPYMPMEQVTRIGRRGYTRFSGLAAVGDEIFAVEKSMYRSPHLVRIDSTGRKRYVQEAPSYAGNIKASGDTLWWSETVTGPRWSLSNRSALRYTTASRHTSRTGTRSERYYNPAPSADGKHVSASLYHDFGGTAVAVLKDGVPSAVFEAPDSLQVVETAWLGGDRLFASCISDNGAAIYEVAGGSWKAVLPVQPVTITNLGTSPDGRLMFTSDRTGEHELYTLSLDDREVRQMTNTRYGAKYYQFSTDGRWLYYAADQLDGIPVFRTPTDSLPVKTVDFSEHYRYFLADNLSSQEKEYGCIPVEDVEFSEPKKFSKILHSFNFHSWAPIYFDYDNIREMSFDRIYEMASLGATVLSQNKLNTLLFSAGYSAHKDPDNKSVWRHSAHAKLTYSGLYPIFEASVDYNDRSAIDYEPLRCELTGGQIRTAALYGGYTGRRSIVGRLSVYLPLQWSKGGIYTGFIPRVSYTISNDRYDTGYASWNTDIYRDGMLPNKEFDAYHPGRLYPNQLIQASARTYLVSSTGGFAVYPRFGAGIEAGIVTRLGLKTLLPDPEERGVYIHRPAAYVYMYGYLPGFIPSEGWKITAKYQHSFYRGGLFQTGALNLLPRGLQNNSALLRAACTNEKDILGLGIDYAAPVPAGDLCLAKGLLFIRSITLTPHFDILFNSRGNLFSTGCSATIDLSSVAWFSVNLSAGVTYSYNGGSAFGIYEKSGVAIGHHLVGPVFSMDF